MHRGGGGARGKTGSLASIVPEAKAVRLVHNIVFMCGDRDREKLVRGKGIVVT